MASKLIMEMTGPKGTTKFSYNYADTETTINDVKTLGQALITNGSIFDNPPTGIISAKMITTTETAYDLSD